MDSTTSTLTTNDDWRMGIGGNKPPRIRRVRSCYNCKYRGGMDGEECWKPEYKNYWIGPDDVCDDWEAKK